MTVAIAALFVQKGGSYYGLEGVVSKREASATPTAFRDELIALARSVRP